MGDLKLTKEIVPSRLDKCLFVLLIFLLTCFDAVFGNISYSLEELVPWLSCLSHPQIQEQSQLLGLFPLTNLHEESVDYEVC